MAKRRAGMKATLIGWTYLQHLIYKEVNSKINAPNAGALRKSVQLIILQSDWSETRKDMQDQD